MAQISLKPNTKLVLGLIILAVTLFFCGILVYMAVAGKMRSLNAELIDKQKQVSEDKDMAMKLEESRLKYLDTSSQLRFLESSVSTSAYVPTLLKQLEYLGKSVDLNVLSVRPQPAPAPTPTRTMNSGAQAANGNVEGASQSKAASPDASGDIKEKKDPPYNQLKIEVEVEGKYMNALDFLYKLTTFPKIIAVSSIQMSPSSGSSSEQKVGSPVLGMKISLTAFILKEDAQTKSAESTEGRLANAAG